MSLALVPRADERLAPLERLELLCDPGSINLLRSAVRSRRMGAKAVAGDGVIGASARVDGRPVFCFAQDASFAGGSLGDAHAETVVQVHRLAGRARVPVIGFIESAGARMQEGLAALSGYGRIFRTHVALSGRVPQISIVCGPSAGGGSYAPALTDFVIMAGGRASMFLTGPAVVAKVTGEQVDAAELGGPRVHERNGVCHFHAPTEVDGALLARDLLDYLPQHAGEAPMRWPAVDAPGFAPDAAVPAEERAVYDVRDVIRALVDGGRTLEVAPRFARSVVCALARLDGRAIGVIANQPRHLGGVLDADSSQKAARFVRTCNLYGLPLVVLVDTPGFLPGTRQERAGVIRHGAKLVYAFSEATVPRVTVVLRKAFGGAFIAMNSKELGADFVFAWPRAQLGVMGPSQAVEIIHRREIAAADDPERARRARGRLQRRAPDLGRRERGRVRRRGDRAKRHPCADRRRADESRARRRAALAGRERAAVSIQVQSAPRLEWDSHFDALATGQRFATRGRTVTEADVVAFAGLTGDYHPQHADAEWARNSEFGQRIAHGMLIVSFAVGLLPFEPERVLALRRVADVVFKRPVLLGDTIHVEGEIERLRPVDGRAGLVSFRCSILNQSARLVCRALVDVLWRVEAAS